MARRRAACAYGICARTPLLATKPAGPPPLGIQN